MSKPLVLSLLAISIVGLLFSLWPTRSVYTTEIASPDHGDLLPIEAHSVHFENEYTVLEHHAGRVVARRTSELGFERSGRLERVFVDIGAEVESGHLLAILDTRVLRASEREAVARLQQATARKELARRTHARRRELQRGNHLSSQHLDEAQAELEISSAERSAARAALERIRLELELSELRAPFAGQVAARSLDEGTIVAPGRSVLRLVESAELEVHVGLPTATAAKLEVGGLFHFEIGRNLHSGVLRSVVAEVEASSRTILAIFELEGDVTELNTGDLARLSVEQRQPTRGAWLPIAALGEGRRGLWSAFALVPDPANHDAKAHRVERRQIEVLHTEANRAFIRGTLVDGDRVIAAGLNRVVPGQRVRIEAPE
ncbi:MAG: efflux RND transporter periplasmic adaptor subunit [bacterium]|nr:efflux RND transporter periplasmic adaptor subunit [bacterium]